MNGRKGSAEPDPFAQDFDEPEAAMAALRPKELLDLLLEGNTLTPDELDQFIGEHRDEGQYFDCKDGAITTPARRKDGSQIIRKWVSGFANSDGGTLIVGVNEPADKNEPRKITACEARVGGQTLEEWATRCLLAMAGSFSPPPRFKTIQHHLGPVLTIAVARAPALVPCVEAGELKYFLRIHDSTVEAPAYLITDLVLGRRQHPVLELSLGNVQQGRVDLEPGDHHRTSVRPPGFRIPGQSVSFDFTIENVSLTTATEVTVGMVSWSLIVDGTKALSPHVRAYLDIIDIPFQRFDYSEPKVIQYSSIARGRTMTLPPFQTDMVPGIGPFYLPQMPLKVTCAVYVIPKSAPPTWFQLEFESLPGRISERVITRKVSERPKVAWEAAPIPKVV